MFLSFTVSAFSVIIIFYMTNTHAKTHIIANWKSFLTKKEATNLALSIYESQKLNEEYSREHDKNIVLLPPTLFYSDIQNIFKGTPIEVGVQKSSPCKQGPYTGETPVSALKSVDCKYCLSGHYERRRHFAETDESIYRNIAQLLIHNITPIVCIGDSKEEFQENRTVYSCLTQIYRLMNYLKRTEEVSETKYPNILFVYEPIWAIGTGIIPNQEFNERVYCSMQSFISYKYGFNPTILYGGSVNIDNIHQMKIFNGLLVGQASINPYTFNEICRRF
jgi:triosephosphate isomerase